MVREHRRCVSNHEGFRWRDHGAASWFETRFALLIMWLVERFFADDS
jgi:hypothetical protein